MNEKRLTAELNHTKELNQSQMTQIGVGKIIMMLYNVL